MPSAPVFRSAFVSADPQVGLGKIPVVFDILGPDRESSILPADLRMVLHVNPTQMRIQYTRQVERIQTRGGYVEQHWGDAVNDISFEQQTGGFMRLYSGLSNITDPKWGGTRRETIAYDKYLDMLALFYNNGTVYDSKGDIVLDGIIKMTFAGGVYLGWFSSFNVTETADRAYQFAVSQSFTVDTEVANWLSALSSSSSLATEPPSVSDDIGQMPLE